MRVFMIAIWVLMVMMTGYALFHISYQVEALEGQLAELNHQIESEKEKVHNLKAEWSYVTRPDWLESLGDEFMPDYTRLSPQQVLQIEDIPFRRQDEATAEAARAKGNGSILPELRATDIAHRSDTEELAQ